MAERIIQSVTIEVTEGDKKAHVTLTRENSWPEPSGQMYVPPIEHLIQAASMDIIKQIKESQRD